ncbi:hypothetical protein M436DRAFT_84605 [Aureobasidium namibiae CBS 147.97]|uniref:Uncharacterized protein n=1 Tax=Aureobasidium namibiae CBS 147.97 TaxID=1043004 RepID=A0A074X7C9_9PEZI|nr:uncharacterized protein M436DRAFT_84605 [Aureobasidium namibiae CBS 147.97]KEQ70516.1 hypothetical protein M436DRAFT_84605 [Aureobasidium namibiae CBS 147.97]
MSGYEPWKRHLDDLTKDANSFSLAFIQNTLVTFPEVVKNALIQEVRDARIDFAVDQSILNLREQALISLLDAGALNTEPGGAWQHDPTTKDEMSFVTLRTRVSTQIAASTKVCGSNELRQLQDLAHEIQQYANDNPVLTGTNVFAFVQTHQDAIVKGMTPSLLHNKFTPFVTMSSDIPLTSFKDPHTFLLGACCSSHLTATVFNYFGAWEEGLNKFDADYVPQMVKDHRLPFIDMFPWPKKDPATFASAVDFLRKYFSIVNPLVVLTHGHGVSSTAIGNLQHPHGLQKGGLLDAIGQIHISNHTSSTVDSGYYVVVPSLHPGTIAYRGTAAIDTTKSLFYMGAMVGWLAYHEALSRSHSTDAKKAICEQIVTAADAKVGKDTAFGKRLEVLKVKLNAELANQRRGLLTKAEKSARLAAARAAAMQLTQERWSKSDTARPSGQDTTALKLKYVVYSGARGVIMVTPLTVWTQARKELDVILQSGFCFTVPESQERTVEVTAIYDKHVAALQHSAASLGDKTKFVQFAKSSKVVRGSSYYLSSATVDDAVKDLPNLIRCFLPDTVTDPYAAKWSRHPTNTMQTAAIKALRAWLREGAATATNNDNAADLVSDTWAEHMNRRDPAVFSLIGTRGIQGHIQTSIFSTDDDLNGTEITIRSHNSNWDATVIKHSFSWMTSNGTVASMDNLPLPRTAMPQTDRDKRFVFFVPEGIDIRDQDGTSIDAYELKGRKQAGKQAGKLRTPVYPTISIATLVATLPTHPHGKDFLKLWEDQTGLKVDEALQSSHLQSIAPSSDQAFITAEYFAENPSRALPLCQEYNANAKRAVQALLPAYPGDGLWLMHEFWTDAYPEGGEVRITNPAEDTSGDSVYDKLAVFLQKPLYREHPSLLSLRALVQLSRNGGLDKKKSTSTIKSSADVLRGFTKPLTISSLRVKINGKSVVTGLTRFSINAVAPNGVIASVPPPVLTSAEVDITDEKLDEEDGSEREEDRSEREEENFATHTKLDEMARKRPRDESEEREVRDLPSPSRRRLT